MQRPGHPILILILLLICSIGGCSAPEPDGGAESVSPSELPMGVEEIDFIEPAPPYLQEVEEFRSGREERLRSETGWLSLVGLFWFEEGENRFGTDPSNQIIFPPNSAPALAGSFFFDGESVEIEAVRGVELTLNGEVLSGRRALQDDRAESMDLLGLGRLSFFVINREGRLGLRVKDPESPARVSFTGLEYFPVNAAYRVVAQFEPYDLPREIAISSVIGTSSSTQMFGELHFNLGGASHTLLPIGEPHNDNFFIILRDLTSGAETYAAGRYLLASTEDLGEGQVVLDFNKAYNPPCIFTPYATCPLPPPGNDLKVRIEAGEKSYGEH